MGKGLNAECSIFQLGNSQLICAVIAQVSKVMEKFEEQFTDLDVRTSVWNTILLWFHNNKNKEKRVKMLWQSINYICLRTELYGTASFDIYYNDLCSLQCYVFTCKQDV